MIENKEEFKEELKELMQRTLKLGRCQGRIDCLYDWGNCITEAHVSRNRILPVLSKFVSDEKKKALDNQLKMLRENIPPPKPITEDSIQKLQVIVDNDNSINEKVTKENFHVILGRMTGITMKKLDELSDLV